MANVYPHNCRFFMVLTAGMFYDPKYDLNHY
jgi:hypothetical protein